MRISTPNEIRTSNITPKNVPTNWTMIVSSLITPFLFPCFQVSRLRPDPWPIALQESLDCVDLDLMSDFGIHAFMDQAYDLLSIFFAWFGDDYKPVNAEAIDAFLDIIEDISIGIW